MIRPFQRRPALQPALAEGLQHLARRPPNEQGLDDRWVVADVETGGLNPRADPLLAIGAVTLRDGAIAMAPVCEVRLRQPEATTTLVNGASPIMAVAPRLARISALSRVSVIFTTSLSISGKTAPETTKAQPYLIDPNIGIPHFPMSGLFFAWKAKNNHIIQGSDT